MFEAYTLLGAIAARTKTAKARDPRHRRHVPEPAILAKIVTQPRRDLRRAGLPRDRRRAGSTSSTEGLGVDFPPVKERFERLEEALQICRAMFRDERPTFEGQHYRTHEALNSPPPSPPAARRS